MLVRTLHLEFTDVVKNLQDDTGNLFLVEILKEMNFLTPDLIEG
jgi:hypothetical protein